MKVYYKLPGVAGAWTLLADETDPAGALPIEWAVEFKQVNQQAPLCGGLAQFRAARGNVTCEMALTFNSVYGSRALCMAAILTNGQLLNQTIHLRVDQDAHIQYYPDALVERYKPVPMGVAATHSFQFTSDNVTSVEP